MRRAAPAVRLAAEANAWLVAREWPGNVRELRALVETAVALAGPEGTVDAALLRFAAGEVEEVDATPPAAPGRLEEAIAALEARMLREVLAETRGNQSEAARRLGISRPGLIKKIARLGLR